ncbi:MAG: hypothetical protein WCI11_08370 [Candidatus Methylumidiphilus sp.]
MEVFGTPAGRKSGRGFALMPREFHNADLGIAPLTKQGHLQIKWKTLLAIPARPGRCAVYRPPANADGRQQGRNT